MSMEKPTVRKITLPKKIFKENRGKTIKRVL